MEWGDAAEATPLTGTSGTSDPVGLGSGPSVEPSGEARAEDSAALTAATLFNVEPLSGPAVLALEPGESGVAGEGRPGPESALELTISLTEAVPGGGTAECQVSGDPRKRLGSSSWETSGRKRGPGELEEGACPFPGCGVTPGNRQQARQHLLACFNRGLGSRGQKSARGPTVQVGSRPQLSQVVSVQGYPGDQMPSGGLGQVSQVASVKGYPGDQLPSGGLGQVSQVASVQGYLGDQLPSGGMGQR